MDGIFPLMHETGISSLGKGPTRKKKLQINADLKATLTTRSTLAVGFNRMTAKSSKRRSKMKLPVRFSPVCKRAIVISRLST